MMNDDEFVGDPPKTVTAGAGTNSTTWAMWYEAPSVEWLKFMLRLLLLRGRPPVAGLPGMPTMPGEKLCCL